MSEKIALREAHQVRDWVLFCTGAAAQACYADTGDEGRNERSRWAGRTLTELMPAMSALLRLAERYPQEFALLLGEPIEVEQMP